MNQEKDHFTQVEVEERIAKISNADITKLVMIFNSMGCQNRIGWNAFELLNHVIERLLEGGKRKWPTNVDMLTFVKNAGRSLINNEEKKRKRTTNKSIEFDEFQDSSSQDINDRLVMNLSIHPDEAIENEEDDNANLRLFKKITLLFKDNESILCILKKQYENVKKAIILNLCSLSESEYISLKNKIKYKLKKEYPHGYEHEVSS
jgi:hypothetical protein